MKDSLHLVHQPILTGARSSRIINRKVTASKNGLVYRRGNRTQMNNHKRTYPRAKACEFCEETERLVRHHPDYAYPQIYVTCCSLCHSAIHNVNCDDKHLEMLFVE